MKIAYCIKSLHVAGGMERVITAKANYLVEQGHEVAIITTETMGRKPFFPLHPSIQQIDLGVNYDCIDTSSRLKKYSALYRYKRRHKQLLAQCLRELRPDVVISTGYQDFSFLPSIKDGSIKITESHGSWGKTVSAYRFPATNYLRRFLSWWAERSFARTSARYTRTVLLTHEDAVLWGDRLKRVEVIYNIMPITSERVAPLQAKRCIAVARFAHEKDLRDTLDIWAMVSKKHPDWRLDIYGEGYLHDQLMHQLRELHLEDSCALHTPTNTITEEYLSSSVLLMTSQTEGLPMVLLEAQELGLPSVCYAFLCGARDVIEEASEAPGFVVPYGDKAAFAECLERLMADEELRLQMGRAAKANAQRFAPEVILPQWDRLFRSLVSSK